MRRAITCPARPGCRLRHPRRIDIAASIPGTGSRWAPKAIYDDHNVDYFEEGTVFIIDAGCSDVVLKGMGGMKETDAAMRRAGERVTRHA